MKVLTGEKEVKGVRVMVFNVTFIQETPHTASKYYPHCLAVCTKFYSFIFKYFVKKKGNQLIRHVRGNLSSLKVTSTIGCPSYHARYKIY